MRGDKERGWRERETNMGNESMGRGEKKNG
jgi:hypothetical protein